ncbi:TrbG/VirB9 family P-type conjugative transfer protein (plasmid) [Skermanella rosea]|uniref:TrbG/VirB9 family P-type conjugative transfer protein n=1 Tax=Skermanella rosea TaxID=1817965 RepID=UPI001931802E|nr:TrbG/VirB9 family P-type conjugative transfer protein [Skermanella rosea]UEM06767.1 TrbG/VirB9 family P-type conjugative transfer protein [Skermanella rosea]
MKRLAAVALPALLAACATTREEPATHLVPVLPEPPVQVVEKVVPVLVTPAPVIREKPRKQDPVAATRRANARAMEMPRAERFIGSTLEYPLVPGAVYNVLTAVNDITAIEIPPGCRMVKKAPMLGDPSHESDDRAGATAEDMELANWVIAKTFHGTPRDPVSKVVVRPNKPGLRTSLLIDSDCGAFRYRLISTESSANATVRFRQEQPNMGMPEPPYADEREKTRPAVLSCTDTPISQVQYGYTVSGDKPAWRPADRDVFHNGSKLCIGMPGGLGDLETPSISRPAGGDAMTVHYRTSGRFIEIDQVVPVLNLTLGDDTVRLTLKR